MLDKNPREKILLQTVISEFPVIVPGCDYFFLFGYPCLFRKKMLSIENLTVKINAAYATFGLEYKNKDGEKNKDFERLKQRYQYLKKSICEKCEYKKTNCNSF